VQMSIAGEARVVCCEWGVVSCVLLTVEGNGSDLEE
jgi:hypothetical protein